MTESMKTFLAKVSADKALAEKAAKLDKPANLFASALKNDAGIIGAAVVAVAFGK